MLTRTSSSIFICALVGCLAMAACGGDSRSSSSIGVLPHLSSSRASVTQASPLSSSSPVLPTPPPAPTATPIWWSELIGLSTFPAGDTAVGGQGAPVDGIPCDNKAITYHIHSHVTLFYQGTKRAIPIAIGAIGPVYSADGLHVIRATCFYHLHTHDSSGLIHIENNVVPLQPFTLGEVFDIWGEPLTTSNIAGFMGPVLVYTAQCAPTVPFNCDWPTVYTGDPRAIVLTQHEQITLEVGGPYKWPPYYQWSEVFGVGIRLNGEMSIADPNYGFELGYVKGTGTTTQTISLPAGEKVQFHNYDTIAHSAAFLDNATATSAAWPASFTGSTTQSPTGTAIGTSGWATGSLNPGTSSRIFDTGLPGFYIIGCQYHYVSNEMRTVIIVQ